MFEFEDRDYISTLYKYSQDASIPITDIDTVIENYRERKLDRLNALKNLELKKLNKKFEKEKNTILKRYDKMEGEVHTYYSNMHKFKDVFCSLVDIDKEQK